MTFLAPQYLWAFLALLPLAAVYFLKVRPRRQPTNAFFLWQKVFEQKQSSALFKKLRDLLSLLLLLLAASLIALAMAKPRLGLGDQRDLLVLIDRSASMQAGPAGDSAFDQALQEARALVNGLDDGRRMALATVHQRLRFHQHLTDSPLDLRRQLEALTPTNLPLTDQLSPLLTPYLQDQKRYRVLFLTDGQAVPELAGLEPLLVGKNTSNLGLTAADLAWSPTASSSANLSFEALSTHSESVTAEAELREAKTGVISRLIPLQLSPGLTQPAVITLENLAPGDYQLVLTPSDAFPLDNEVTFHLPPRPKIRVALQTDQPFFFQKAIEAFSRNSGLLTLTSPDQADVLITTGSEPPSEKPHLVFNSTSEGTSPLEILAPEARIADHPALQHLDLEALAFPGAQKRPLPPGSTVLVASEEDLALISQQGQTLRYNLDPAVGDFYFSPWFPILLYQGCRALVPTPDEPAVAPTASALAENPPLGLQTSPEGDQISLALLSQAESQLPQQDRVGTIQQAATARGWPLSTWLLVLALLILTSEAALYHRRKLG